MIMKRFEEFSSILEQKYILLLHLTHDCNSGRSVLKDAHEQKA